MKRIFGTALVIAVLIMLMAAPASAAAYVDTLSFEFNTSYYHDYNDGNGRVVFSFEPSSLWGSPSVSTEIGVSTGMTGRVVAGISQYDDHANTASSNEEINNEVTCIVTFQTIMGYTPNYATKSYHYANRRVAPGTEGISYWEYTYISSHHYDDVKSVVMVPVVE